MEYAKQREQFKRPIGSFQAVKHMCAEMAAQLEPCRSMVWFAGHALAELPDEGRITACHTTAHLPRSLTFSPRRRLKCLAAWALPIWSDLTTGSSAVARIVNGWVHRSLCDPNPPFSYAS